MAKTAKTKTILNITYNDNSSIMEIGIDEVGRGPMFGRVYTAAVILPKKDFKFELLKDSKKFTSSKKIQEAAAYIKENALAYSIAWEDEKSVDCNNIRISTFMAMHKAIDDIIKSNLSSLNNYQILADGNDFKPYMYINDDTMLESLNHVCIEGGDNKYCSIAAASILAKVERDRYIENLCLEYPKLNKYYDLLKNKGYGTKNHMEGIRTYGVSRWHRRSFGLCGTTFENNEF